MQSEPKAQEKAQEIDPKEVGIAPETEPPGRIYKQVVREVLARIDQRLADIERQAVPEPAEGQPNLAGRVPLSRHLKRGFIALLLSAGLIGAAYAWQRSDSDAAKAMVARWTPRFLSNVLSRQDNQDSEAVTVGTAADGGTTPEVRSALTDVSNAPMDRTTPEADGQSAVSASTDLATTIEKMSRDITTLSQGIEQLKASQEQMSRDSAKATEQFKASEDQLIRMLLRVTEQQSQSPQARGTAAAPQGRNAQTRNAGAPPPRGNATRPRQAAPSFFSRRPT